MKYFFQISTKVFWVLSLLIGFSGYTQESNDYVVLVGGDTIVSKRIVLEYNGVLVKEPTYKNGELTRIKPQKIKCCFIDSVYFLRYKRGFYTKTLSGYYELYFGENAMSLLIHDGRVVELPVIGWKKNLIEALRDHEKLCAEILELKETRLFVGRTPSYEEIDRNKIPAIVERYNAWKESD